MSLDKMQTTRCWWDYRWMLSVLWALMLTCPPPGDAIPQTDVSSPSITNINVTPKEEKLIQAASSGALGRVRILVARGADVDYDSGEALAAATENGHIEIVKVLLEAGANPNGTVGSEDYNYDVGKPLLAAARHNQLEIIDLLIDAGAAVDFNNSYYGPLETAVEHGNLEAVLKLLERGADPTFDNSSALHIAIREGGLDMIKTLIDAGADVNDGNGVMIETAAFRGNLEVVRLLIDAGANKEYIVGAAQFAAIFGQHEVLKELITYGTSPELGFALQLVAISNDAGIIKTLIDAGVNDTHLSGALAFAALYDNFDVAKLLIERGADPNGENVLKYAAQSGNLEMVKFLLDSGSNITCIGEEDLVCPWHYAAMIGHPGIISLFAEHGADINSHLVEDNFTALNYKTSVDAEGWTVMHVAARYGSPVAGELIKLGTDLNAKDARGRTPLQVAVQYDKLIVAKELLSYCADLNSRDEEGKTALDMAEDLALQNTLNVSGYEKTMAALKKALPEKIASLPFNREGIISVRDGFLLMLDVSATLRDSLELENVRYVKHHIYDAAWRVFQERARENMTKAIEDQKCKASLPEADSVAMETEYVAKCVCIPSQGPQMTFVPIDVATRCAPEIPMKN